MSGVARIAREQARQRREEGYSQAHDDEHVAGELARAAATYALPAAHRDVLLWPWEQAGFKPTPDNRIRELEKAGALIAAEIDRLERQA